MKNLDHTDESSLSRFLANNDGTSTLFQIEPDILITKPMKRTVALKNINSLDSLSYQQIMKDTPSKTLELSIFFKSKGINLNPRKSNVNAQTKKLF